LEASSEGAAEHAAAAVPLPASAVPASLHASLMARLDRLGDAEEVVQIGAAMRLVLEGARNVEARVHILSKFCACHQGDELAAFIRSPRRRGRAA